MSSENCNCVFARLGCLDLCLFVFIDLISMAIMVTYSCPHASLAAVKRACLFLRQGICSYSLSEVVCRCLIQQIYLHFGIGAVCSAHPEQHVLHCSNVVDRRITTCFPISRGLGLGHSTLEEGFEGPPTKLGRCMRYPPRGFIFLVSSLLGMFHAARKWVGPWAILNPTYVLAYTSDRAGPGMPTGTRRARSPWKGGRSGCRSLTQE